MTLRKLIREDLADIQENAGLTLYFHTEQPEGLAANKLADQ